jgi:CRP/FNR family transcriptional regulator
MQLRRATTRKCAQQKKTRKDNPQANMESDQTESGIYQNGVDKPARRGRSQTASLRATANPFQALACKKCDVRPGCLIQSLYKSSGDPSLLLNHQRILSPGEHLFHAGEHADAIYLVSSGSVKAYVIMEDGEEQVTNFFLSGDVVALDSFGSGRHISSAVALETTTICKLPHSILTKYAPSENLLATFSHYLAHDHNMKLILARKDADSRMASFLLNIADHYENLGQTSDIFYLTMTRHDIANYLGMAIETVSRTLRRFRDNGILAVTRRNICIEDFASLENIAGKQVTP